MIRPHHFHHLCIAATLVLSLGILRAAEPLTIAYSDWPGWAALKIAEERGLFREAGVDVKLVWQDYGATLEGFQAGKSDAVACTNGDMLVMGAAGKACKAILVTDMSYGNDMVIGKPGVTSIKDLKGKKVGIETGMVPHLLLLKALDAAGMKEGDVTIVKIVTVDAPKVLAAGDVDAVAAWYPIAGQVLSQVEGSRPLFTSKNAPGLIYDVICVSAESLSTRRAEWAKVVSVWPKIVSTITDPATRPEAVKIMAALVQADAATYEKALPGTRLLDAAGNKRVMVRSDGIDSLFGSSVTVHRFNLQQQVYTNELDPASFIDTTLVDELN